MCGRYVNLTDFVFRSIYGFDRVVPLPPLEPLFNIAPKSFAPIVRVSSGGEIEQVLARWGLVPASFPTLEHANKFNMTNARAETVRESNAFKHAYRSRRCLVPSNGFYEWKRFDDGKKWPYLIGLDNLEPLAYAGIWECWERDERTLESFSILTTTPNELMVRIHDRMPVILAQSDWHTWLDPQASTQTLECLLVPYPARGMDAFLVSPKVGSVKATGPELLEPLL
jgi:putative SOS response-associated peptidase YedK